MTTPQMSSEAGRRRAVRFGPCLFVAETWVKPNGRALGVGGTLHGVDAVASCFSVRDRASGDPWEDAKRLPRVLGRVPLLGGMLGKLFFGVKGQL